MVACHPWYVEVEHKTDAYIGQMDKKKGCSTNRKAGNETYFTTSFFHVSTLRRIGHTGNCFLLQIRVF